MFSDLREALVAPLLFCDIFLADRRSNLHKFLGCARWKRDLLVKTFLKVTENVVFGLFCFNLSQPEIDLNGLPAELRKSI